MTVISKPHAGALHDSGASRLLLFLFCGDLIFGVLHLLNERTALLNVPRLSLELDQGYPEMYQYLKFFWTGAILTVYAFKVSSWHYLTWTSVFAYFLLDDSLRVHERLGRHVAKALDFAPIGGLRLQDYGEAIVSGVAAVVLLGPLVLAYRNGPVRFRKLTHDLGLLVLMMAFFGVFMDAVDVTITEQVDEFIHFLMGMFEDGGEMLVASLLLWYVFLMSRRGFASPVYLVDSIRALFRSTGTNSSNG